MGLVHKTIANFIKKLRRGTSQSSTAFKPGPLENMVMADGPLPPEYTPLIAPVWLPAQNAKHMRRDDPVLGLLADGAQYALPWWIMKNHHVANLTLEGRPIVVKLCELCSSAAAFNPVVQGARLTFQVIGAYKGTFVTRDFETHSIWAPFTGECLTGPLQGKKLAQLPLYQSTWKEWVGLYPKSLVPDGLGESRKGHGAAFYPGSADSETGLNETLVHRDGRLPYNELVLGVKSGKYARAYPLARLHQLGPVLNDALDLRKIAIFSKPQSWMAMAFAREVDGECLDFEVNKYGNILDRDTKSLWDLSGRAISGPLAGRTLSFIPSLVEEWYAWASYYPDTEIFDGPNHP